MVRSVFPGYRAIGSDLDELELNGFAGGHGGIEKPVGIIRIEHGTDSSVPSRAPVAQFHSVAREKDIVASIGGCSVVYGECYRNQLGGQHRKLNGVTGGSAGVRLLGGCDGLCA